MSTTNFQNRGPAAGTLKEASDSRPGDLESPHTAAAIEHWAIAKLSEALGVTPAEIDVHESLDNYGMGSIQAVSFAGDLEEWLGRDLPATLLWDYPTLAALAAHLAEDTLTT
jgi:acyl carrier protein